MSLGIHHELAQELVDECFSHNADKTLEALSTSCELFINCDEDYDGDIMESGFYFYEKTGGDSSKIWYVNYKNEDDVPYLIYFIGGHDNIFGQVHDIVDGIDWEEDL